MALIKATAVDESFMARPRIGTFISSRDSQAPFGVPVWFDWNGSQIQLFSARDAYKIHCLQAGRAMTLLAHNLPDEPERWFSFEGRPEIRDDGAFELAERLAARYWDLTQPGHLKMLETWQAHRDALCRVVLTPETIRTGQ